MREILFRGKRIDNGKWIQGFLVIWECGYYIVPNINAYASMGGRGKGKCMMFGHYYQVHSETVGQFTGLTDKNGKKIFEGDIIKATDSVPEYNLMVVRNEGFGCFNDYYFGGKKHYTEQIRNADWYLCYKIIGNIHDNPELLEEKE